MRPFKLLYELPEHLFLKYSLLHAKGKLFLFFSLCTQFPQIGELILQRLILQFKRGFRRNDKALCLSSTRFVAHLVNQQVVRVTMRFIHKMTTDYKKKHVTVLLLLKFHTQIFRSVIRVSTL